MIKAIVYSFFRFLLPPLLSGLAIAFVIILGVPDLRTTLLSKLSFPSQIKTSHMSFAAGVKKAAPAVVTIFSEGDVNEPRYKRQNTVQELGSGVIMTADGYVLTNYHVVNNADQIVVILTDGRTFTDVQLIGFDPITDLALLKIEANNLPVIPINDQFIPEVGDVVLAIGNPLNLGQTITQGIISATGKQTLTDSPYNSLLQMDAAVNMGNSGGALVNSNGILVGITSAQFRTRYNIDIQGISFAVPYTLAKEVMKKLIEDGRVVRGYLGFTGKPVDKFGIEITDRYTPVFGILISDLDPLGPAWQAGMKDNDIIVKMAGQSVTNPQAALHLVGNTRPGTKLTFEIYREGEYQEVVIEVAELETRI